MSTPPAITVKEDFADWLNPMLVKELRQGLKTKAFVIVFVLVQVALVILMGFRLLAQNDPFGYTAGMLDGLLWTAIGGALLVLMPLRALTAISEEEKANTLHLVQLTRLSSTRIVWGKWIALVSQTLLLSVAILPYAVLRYFFGGIDIVENLLLLVWMMVGSMALTAACLVLSTHAMPTRIVLLVDIEFSFRPATRSCCW
jgi:ABC-type transport system involved in multi-copper enzyme maturation permease subunit